MEYEAPDKIEELRLKVKELEVWKKQAIEVMPPYQEIAQELGIKLGESIHDKILPNIKMLKKRISELESHLEHIYRDI